jgi:HD superfamily phosphohydrolase
VIILLCQGLIFENVDDTEYNNKVITSFGVLIIVLLLGTFILSFVKMFKRIYQHDVQVIVSLNAMKYFSSEAQQELMQALIDKQIENLSDVNVSQAHLVRYFGKEVLDQIYAAVDSANTLTQTDVNSLNMNANRYAYAQ